MPQLKDSLFENTVSVVCQHNDEGAVALVINKPLPQTLSEIFQQLDLPLTNLNNPKQSVRYGGPVQPEAGFVLHTNKGKWQSTLAISKTLYLTSSRDILEAISKGKGPKHYIFIFGYAGWSPGQIEFELEQNSWLHHPIETDVVFNTPPEKLSSQIIVNLGIDPQRISSQVGHA